MNTAKTMPKKKHPLVIFLIELFTARAGFHLAQHHTNKEKHRA